MVISGFNYFSVHSSTDLTSTSDLICDILNHRSGTSQTQ